MRTGFSLALAALTIGLATAASADPLKTCTVPPVPPAGCSSQKAQCLCDADGNCRWVYDCTQR